MLKRLVCVLLISLAVTTACNSRNIADPNKVKTEKDANVLHTMLVVGDIEDYNNDLKSLAELLLKENPQASFWIMGDAGYGDSESVAKNYDEIAASIPKEKLHMLVGDHDYGTQNEKKFTNKNLINTGSSKTLNSEDEFVYTINAMGTLNKKDIDSKDVAWTISGTNDICVEIKDDKNSQCDNSRIEKFNNELAKNNELSSCSVAMWHHPIYGVLKNGGSDHANSETYGKPLFASSINNGVDMVLNGDHHQFLATKPIDIDGKSSKSEKTLREFIVGSGGAPLSKNNYTPKLKKGAIDADIRNEIGILEIKLFKGSAKLNFFTSDGSKYKTTINC